MCRATARISSGSALSGAGLLPAAVVRAPVRRAVCKALGLCPPLLVCPLASAPSPRNCAAFLDGAHAPAWTCFGKARTRTRARETVGGLQASSPRCLRFSRYALGEEIIGAARCALDDACGRACARVTTSARCKTSSAPSSAPGRACSGSGTSGAIDVTSHGVLHAAPAAPAASTPAVPLVAPRRRRRARRRRPALGSLHQPWAGRGRSLCLQASPPYCDPPRRAPRVAPFFCPRCSRVVARHAPQGEPKEHLQGKCLF